ncbi:9742_t:CDS:2 [Diversispora eburnea]|uniref:9742_t:CDS:1 n=1 Tax=Diversispora eburnea TaxID=1213867 RepID=A0A9N9BB65_9GLOM|nr:9742_t:CDS:2 [Diversispora eburnea]
MAPGIQMNGSQYMISHREATSYSDVQPLSDQTHLKDSSCSVDSLLGTWTCLWKRESSIQGVDSISPLSYFVFATCESLVNSDGTMPKHDDYGSAYAATI